MIYFIQQGDDGPIKIGYAKSYDGVKVRLKTFQTGHSHDLRLLHVIEGDRTRESDLHERFAEHRVRGEWFSPVPAILELCQPLPSPERVGEAVQRWWHNGLIDDAGRLSVQGELYVAMLEEAATYEGIDLDASCRRVTEWLDAETAERREQRNRSYIPEASADAA